MMNSPEKWLTPSVAETLLTPQVIVHEQQLNLNIQNMAEFGKEYSLRLRPHFKTHKTAEILQLQLNYGAVGVTVAKIGEAEEIVSSALFQDRRLSILIAYPIVSELNFQRILQLQKRADIILMVDHLDQARALNSFAERNKTSFPIMVKINSGLNRCGLEPDNGAVVSFIRELLSYHQLVFLGLMTHAGHAYGAGSASELQRIGREEAEVLLSLQKELQEELGLSNIEISVGSTPTARISGAVSGVTELRPGNYVFYDRTQVGLGIATYAHCALRVASRIVSQPAANRWIIDAGSKTLTLDQGAHGQKGVEGYGYVVGEPGLTITRLSEEHGVLEGDPATSLKIGDIIEIIPNHACPIVNLTDELFVLPLVGHPFSWKVRGRGRSR